MFHQTMVRGHEIGCIVASLYDLENNYTSTMTFLWTVYPPIDFVKVSSSISRLACRVNKLGPVPQLNIESDNVCSKFHEKGVSSVCLFCF